MLPSVEIALLDRKAMGRAPDAIREYARLEYARGESPESLVFRFRQVGLGRHGRESKRGAWTSPVRLLRRFMVRGRLVRPAGQGARSP